MAIVSAPQNIPRQSNSMKNDNVGSPENVRQLLNLCSELRSYDLSPDDATWGIFCRILLNSNGEKLNGTTFQDTFTIRLCEYIENTEGFLKTTDHELAHELLKSMSKASLVEKLGMIKSFENNSSAQGRLWARVDGWGM